MDEVTHLLLAAEREFRAANWRKKELEKKAVWKAKQKHRRQQRGKLAAWVQRQHPNMSRDEARCMAARILADESRDAAQRVMDAIMFDHR